MVNHRSVHCAYKWPLWKHQDTKFLVTFFNWRHATNVFTYLLLGKLSTVPLNLLKKDKVSFAWSFLNSGIFSYTDFNVCLCAAVNLHMVVTGLWVLWVLIWTHTQVWFWAPSTWDYWLFPKVKLLINKCNYYES